MSTMNLLSILIVIWLGADAGTDAEPTSVGLKVVEFARSKLGQKVGDGQCTSLAREAMISAGAERPRGEGGWGPEVKNLAGVRPGDILQFEDAVFVQRRLRDDGAVIKLTLTAPHHAAIVANVNKQGKDVQIVVLHQNAGFTKSGDDVKKVVQEWTFTLAEKKSGVLKAFRPVDEPATRGP